MIVQCADCKSRFQLEAARVPKQQIRVRCSKCAYVFTIDGQEADMAQAPAQPSPEAPSPALKSFGEVQLESGAVESAPTKPAPASPQPAPAQAQAPPPELAPAAPEVEMDFEIERSAGPALGGEPAAAPRGQAATVAGAPSPAGTFTEIDLDEKPKAEAVAQEQNLDPETKKKQDKARRLARALVSDILVYNKDSRDKALAKGNLVQALGPEIKKSWEVYKERVTPEIANSTDHFRNALNEILADGQPIF